VKPRVHFHSDNDTFAGCEQMLVVLFGEAMRTNQIEPSLSFRASDLYERGLRSRVSGDFDSVALRLPDTSRITERLRKALPGSFFRPLRGLVHLLIAALPIRQLFQLYDTIVIWRLLARLKPDIVHVNNGGFPGAASCSAAAIAARLAGIRHIVYVVNNIAYGYGTPQRWFEYPIDRATAACVSRFVTGSNEASRKLAAVLRLPPEKTKVIPNGIAVRKPDESPDATRERLGIEKDCVLIACVGSLEARKGHRFLVEAFGLVISQNPGLRASVVIDGVGPEARRLERYIVELGLSGRVRIIPPEKNVWNLYASADIVVLPSVSHEDFPNVVLEAMASGKPVIASAIAGVPEQIVDGETGILVRPADSEALARALARLIESPDLREKLGSAGRRRFEQNFTAQIAAQKYFALYRSLLSS
jgi:glycosyltransferase involved in cell wall biosynthesis